MHLLKKCIVLLASVATVLGLSTLPATAGATPIQNSEASRAAKSEQLNMADPNATAQTRALFEDLYDTKAGNIRFGQQHATDEASSRSARAKQVGDVFELTGRYPAVFGWDISQALRGSEKPGSKQNTTRRNIAALDKAIEGADSIGAIVTLSALMSNPISEHDPKGADGFYDTRRVGDSLLPGGANNKWFNNQLDEYADVANNAKTTDGTLIPIVFRPWLENNGNWYWWGSSEVSHQEFKAIFRYTVDYLRDVKHVHNFLYAYAPDGQNQYFATYPGDAYVDVLGCSEYDWTGGPNTDYFIKSLASDMHVINQFANKHGKVTALTEFGRDDNAHQLKIDGTDADPQFFHKVRAALMQQAPNLAYMLTWANFGDNKPGRPYAYTPWLGDPNQKSVDAFKAFAKESNALWASNSNDSFMKTTNQTAPKAQPLTPDIHLLSPVAGWKITSDHAPITVSAKVTGYDPSQVDAKSVNVQITPIDTSKCQPSGRAVSLNLTSKGNGFYSASFDPAASGFRYDGTWLEFLPKAKTVSGTPISGINDEFIGDTGDGSAYVELTTGTQSKTGILDDFDSYGGKNSNLRSAWTFYHMDSSQASLTNSGAGQNAGKALNLHYDFTKINYNGMGLDIPEKRSNFSGYTHLNLWLKPDGSGNKFVVQLIAGGRTFEAYPDISGTTPQEVSLDLTRSSATGKDGAFTYERGGAGKADISQKDLASVTQFNLYVNQRDNPKGASSGDLQVDSIELSGKRDPYVAPSEPARKPDQTVDDFNSYHSDTDLRKVYVSQNSQYLYSVTRNGADRAMEFKANFDQAGDHYLDVERTSFASSDWSGHNEIDLDVKGDGNSHALSLQVFHNSDYYNYDIPLGMSTQWKTVKIPVSDFTMNIHRMNNSVLENVTGLKIALNRYGDEKSANGDVYVDNIRLTNSASTPGSGKTIVLDNFEEYTSNEAAQAAWSNYVSDPKKLAFDHDLTLVAGDKSGKALHFAGTFTTAPEGNWLDVAKYIGNARKDASGKDLGADWSSEHSMSFDVQGNGKNNALAVSFGTMEGKYYRTKVKLDFTGWKHMDVPLTEFVDDSGNNHPTDGDLKSVKEIVLAANQWDQKDATAVYTIDNLQLNGTGSTSPSTPVDTDPFDQEWGVSNFDDYDRVAPACPVTTGDRLDTLAKENRGTLADGVYIFRTVQNRKIVLDLQNGSPVNGANIRLWQLNGTGAQQWKVTHDSNGYVIITNAASGKALEVYGNSNDPRGSHNIDQWDEHTNQSNQKWIAVRHNRHIILISGQNGEFWGMQFGARVASSQSKRDVKPGTNVWAAPLPYDAAKQQFNYDNAQEWEPTVVPLPNGNYQLDTAIRNGHSLDVAGASHANGANVRLYQTNGTAAQAWTVVNHSDGTVSFINVESRKALDASASRRLHRRPAYGANVQQWAAVASINQRWVPLCTENNPECPSRVFRFQNAGNRRLFLDVASGKTANGTNVRLWGSNPTAAQKWKLIPTLDLRQRLDQMAATHRSDLADGTYRIFSARGEFHVVDVASASHANGANVRIWDSNGTDAQDWLVSHDTQGYVTLTNAESGKVLDADAPTMSRIPTNGANVHQWTRAGSGTFNQKWIAVRNRNDGSLTLYSGAVLGLVFDLRSGRTANGTNIRLWVSNHSAAQRWRFESVSTSVQRLDQTATIHRNDLPNGTYTFLSAVADNRAMDLMGGSHANGANVRLWDDNHTTAQKWIVHHDAKGYLTLINARSGKTLDVDQPRGRAHPLNGANIHQWANANTRNQKWIALKMSDGSYMLLSAASEDHVVDVRSGRARMGTNIRLWERNDSRAQRWFLRQ